ncbi:fluoride efflux transporter FluC [Bifidobacterium myosotis]|uniref:fluoride efflux transporter FluC n=1 Tax=Bifidobacterium myosotis TaxID=1630166 RepID=UPI0037BEA6A4
MSGTSSGESSSAIRTPEIHGMILAIVFAGGTIGTALRYAFAQIPAVGTAGGFHTGTLAANLLACFCYAGLSSFLAGSSRISARHKEFASRGLGMGLCGGLSTMSTLALEDFTSMHGGNMATGIVYLAVTFALGLACAWVGAAAGATLAARNGDDDDDDHAINATAGTRDAVGTHHDNDTRLDGNTRHNGKED